jgi:hypothetical protein
MINQQQPTTPKDVLADILKQTENQADIDALIECRTALNLADRIKHRGIEQANDLDLAAVLLIKLGHIESAQAVSNTATSIRATASVVLPDVWQKMNKAIVQRVKRLHPELPSWKQGTPNL